MTAADLLEARPYVIVACIIGAAISFWMIARDYRTRKYIEPKGILVMIAYESDVGFAIGRLIRAFHEMALRLTGDPRRVHFSFGKINGPCPNLPDGFSNLLEFNYVEPGDSSKLTRYIQQHQIDTMFALDMSVTAPCLKAARAAGVLNVVSYWGAPMSSIVLWKWPLKKLEVIARRSKPDHFIFESYAMQDLGVNGRGLNKRNTSVIRTGVDEKKFRPMPTRDLVYERFGIPRDRKVIIFMGGHLYQRKGVHVLLQAAEYLVASGRKDVHVLLLGKQVEDLTRFYDKSAPFITLGGYQNDIPELLAGCYAGCIPSSGWDSFPMSSLEMQACGVPVIVSDWQGCPETVDETSGVVVPVANPKALGDAIASLVDDPARRERMSQSGRARIEASLTFEHQVRNLVCAMSAELSSTDFVSQPSQ